MCQSRIYFQQYFILPVFPTISGILPPPIFMKLYIQLSYEKAAAWKRLWITHKLASKFKTASHAKRVQSTDFSRSIHHVVQASVSYHISRLSFVLCNSIAKLKYTYTDLYTENVNRAHKGVLLNTEVKCVLCKEAVRNKTDVSGWQKLQTFEIRVWERQFGSSQWLARVSDSSGSAECLPGRE